MTNAKLDSLCKHGQSIWYDYVRRAFIESGELGALVDQGVRGVTSNPSIFEKAIAGSSDYDTALRLLIDEGKTDFQIYEALVLADIREVADVLRPVFESSGGADGYVSLEVNPDLAGDTEGTVRVTSIPLVNSTRATPETDSLFRLHRSPKSISPSPTKPEGRRRP